VDAVSLEPSRPETLANLASALERLALETEREDVRRAWVRALEALRSLGPESPEVWLDLGLAHGGEGPEAEGCLRRALELEPGRPEAADRLGAALIGRGALGDAERVFRDLDERHPMMAVGWAGLGAVAFRRGDAAAAEEHLARALKLDPSCERAHRALALVLEATGRPDDAVPHEEAGGMLRPDQVPGAWATAGLVLEGRGELRRARRCFERKNLYEEILCFEAAARLRPDDPDVAGRLSELYESYGDDARAGEWRLRFGKAARTKHSI
jgi:tetratricopeptide (TPR) repeat protein